MTSRAIGAAVAPPVPDWFWSTTAIASSAGALLVSPGEGDEPRRVRAGDACLACPRLAADRVARDLGGGPRSALDGEPHHGCHGIGRVPAHRLADQCRPLPDQDLPTGPDDPVDGVGLHEPAPDADRAGDHGHLQRRDEHSLLPEGHAPRVDIGVHLRVVEAAIAGTGRSPRARRTGSRAAAARRSRSASRSRGCASRRAPCRCCRRRS